MASSGDRLYRSSFFLLALLGTNPSFADPEASPAASVVSNIITAGVAGFVILALYVGFLTFAFLFKIYKEAAAVRKEAAAHAHGAPFKNILTSLILWIFLGFAVIALSIFLVVSLLADSSQNLSSFSSSVALIISIGVIGFAGVVLYSLVMLLLFFWRKIVGVPEAGHPAPEGALAGIPLNPQVTRRSFLSLLGWAWVAFTAATMGALSTCLRFAFPNVTFEPPLKFAAGFPDSYNMGVDERFKDAHRVWIVRNEQGFYALSTICTHLGCTPNWLSAEQKFKCPCHGSGYYITGVNFEGPTPRPLERFQIYLGDDGQIMVDEGQKFQQELGQWGLPGSFLTYKA